MKGYFDSRCCGVREEGLHTGIGDTKAGTSIFLPRLPALVLSTETSTYDNTACRTSEQTLKETHAHTCTFSSHIYRGNGECLCSNMSLCCDRFVVPRWERRCVQSCLRDPLVYIERRTSRGEGPETMGYVFYVARDCVFAGQGSLTEGE